MASPVTDTAGKVPVTVLSGFLGAGKTTLLSHLINNRSGLRIGMVINDMSEVNIDAALIRTGEASLTRVEDKIVELSNGCICCTLREDLLATLLDLCTMPPLPEDGTAAAGGAAGTLSGIPRLPHRRFDVIIVESSGISEPMPVAETFTFSEEGDKGHSHVGDAPSTATGKTTTTTAAGDGADADTSTAGSAAAAGTAAAGSSTSTPRKLSDYAYLDACVTVVDAFNFMRDYGSRDSLADRKTAAYESDARHVVDLLVDQVEFANILVLNKLDLLVDKGKGSGEGEGEVERMTGVLRALNPSARILKAVRGVVDPAAILNTKLFNLAAAAAAPGWLQELRGTHVPESTEYGISSFVFRAKRPFHPQRLHSLLYESEGLACVVRSKGFFWLAVDGGMDDVGVWGHAGKLYQFSCGSPWWANTPRKHWPPQVKKLLLAKAWKPGAGDADDEDADAGAAAGGAATAATASPFPPDDCTWDPTYGDRRQELVFIGCGMDRGAVETALRSALVTADEYAGGADVWDEWDDPFDFFPYEEEDEEEDEEEEEEEEEEEGDCADGSCGAAHGHAHGHGHSHSHKDAAGATTSDVMVTHVVGAGGVRSVRTAMVAPASDGGACTTGACGHSHA